MCNCIRHYNPFSSLFPSPPSLICPLTTPLRRVTPACLQNQFLTTRNIECPDWITEYLFGGMQYQLEHHLFPTMPRYKYR